MITTNEKRQPDMLTLQQLNDAILKKAFALVEIGEMEQAYWAAKAAKELEDETDQPEFVYRSSDSQKEVDREIDSLLATEYHAFDDRDALEFMKKRWVPTHDAAEFAAVTADTIRNWCNSGMIVCKIKERTDRKAWLVCPRSVALMINDLPDPRLTLTGE